MRNTILKLGNTWKLLVVSILLIVSTNQAIAWWPLTPPHDTGINRTTHPAGLPYASFNNFTDNNNPEPTLNDERQFVVVKNYTNNTAYANNVSAWSWDVVLALAFIHNNGYLNDPNVTATGVATGMNGFTNTWGNYVSGAGTSLTISQFVSAANTTPSSVWDEFTVTSSTWNPIRLQAIGSVIIQSDFLSTFYPGLPLDNFFTGGQSIGDPSGYASGTFRGCMENAMYTFVYFRVLDAPLPPSCTISAAPNPINAGSGSTLTWTSTNATDATIDQGFGIVSLNNSRTVTPAVTTTYTMTVN